MLMSKDKTPLSLSWGLFWGGKILADLPGTRQLPQRITWQDTSSWEEREAVLRQSHAHAEERKFSREHTRRTSIAAPARQASCPRGGGGVPYERSGLGESQFTATSSAVVVYPDSIRYSRESTKPMQIECRQQACKGQQKPQYCGHGKWKGERGKPNAACFTCRLVKLARLGETIAPNVVLILDLDSAANVLKSYGSLQVAVNKR